MKRVSFKSVKASMTGKMKATAAKEEQEYHVAFEREKACALQLEQVTAELNQASMLVCFSIHISIVRSPALIYFQPIYREIVHKYPKTKLNA
jgi:hypothetical protein